MKQYLLLFSRTTRLMAIMSLKAPFFIQIKTGPDYKWKQVDAKRRVKIWIDGHSEISEAYASANCSEYAVVHLL